MTFVDPKTGKEYKTVIEAARATLCPGPCMDCPLRDLVEQDLVEQCGEVSHEHCILWAYDHPTIFAERMGLVNKNTLLEDMTLEDVQQLCLQRYGEYHMAACEGCTLKDPVNGGCILTPHDRPMNWKLSTGLKFDFNERKQLNGLYDAYGAGATIRRYGKTNLVIQVNLAGVSGNYPLPSQWLPNLPEKAYFSLDEARKNKWTYVELFYMEVETEHQPVREPSFGSGQPCQPTQIEQEGQ